MNRQELGRRHAAVHRREFGNLIELPETPTTFGNFAIFDENQNLGKIWLIVLQVS